MMVYRVGLSPFIRDLSGEGARLFGGRWTAVGYSRLYASESRALAALEFLVHGKASSVLAMTYMASIKIPDSVSMRKIEVSALPASFRRFPAPTELQDIGNAWIKSGVFLLRIPSVIVPHEYNYILNVAHADMKKVALISVDDFIPIRYQTLRS